MNYEKVGTLIAELRKEKGLTQQELADKLNITDRAVSKWERGLGCPDISLLEKLSNILEISILELLKGRRLDKDEIIGNKEVLETMKFSKETYKNKLVKYINKIVIVLIFIITGLLIFYNVSSIYYFNKTYINQSFDDYDVSNFNLYQKEVNIIRNNQGNYSDEDYKKIIEYLDYSEKHFNIEKAKKFLQEKSYSYNDLKDFYMLLNNNIDLKNYHYSDTAIYRIVYKYNSNIVDNIIKYYNYDVSIINTLSDFSLELEKPYLNGEIISESAPEQLKSIINLNMYKENILLKDIIKVGEISE